MGERDVKHEASADDLREFTKALLNDVRALERMIDADMFEKGLRRIGAEQELFLVDRDLFPAPIAPQVLETLDPSSFDTELARFNLEINVEPKIFGGSCLNELEFDLRDAIHSARGAAAPLDADVILTGILPTLTQAHLTLDSITPHPRYHELNEAMRRLRGGDFHIHIKGLDELQVTHDNVLVEACNTSFQIHFQVAPDEFARLYNLAQAVSAPVLAAAVNSPVLFRHRLWKETRVALFQHAIDARSETHRTRSTTPRVDLGHKWVDSSVLEIIRDDIARFRVLLARGIEEDALEALARGKVPALAALRLHNGTVYRWNRFCYGVMGGKPHLRIESRALPAGPTVVDEVANAAFFFGLMAGLAEEHRDISQVMSFDDVRTNFYAAARHGLNAQMAWKRGRTHTAESLIRRVLLPKAREGLVHAGIDGSDIDRYLGIIEQRVRHHRTGSRWILDSLAAMGDSGTEDLRYRTLTAAMLDRQKTGEPVHTWPLASPDDAKDWRYSFLNVGQVMSTHLYTVREDDPVRMVAHLMDWNHLRYVPVEDDAGRLLGLVTHRALIRMIGDPHADNASVRDIMRRDVITVTPETPTVEAVRLVRTHQIGCLPVVNEGRLVGVLTASDFLPLYDKVIDEMLKERSRAE
jgi:CBS domain-containing protein